MNKVLFIRRDNIGDLICTTPAIRAVRQTFPRTQIGILANTYNADVVRNHPDINLVHVYAKEKHFPQKWKLLVWRDNLQVLRRIRAARYDIAISCSPHSPSMARYTWCTGARVRIGHVPPGRAGGRIYTHPLAEPSPSLHEVERTFHLLSPLGISGPPPPPSLYPLTEEVRRAHASLWEQGMRNGKPLIGLHISSRRPECQWPLEKFGILGTRMMEEHGAQVFLSWSPGDASTATHPGDDQTAAYLLERMRPQPLAYRTYRLCELIAALSLADLIVCCEGGVMHVAAALGKPLIVLWGSSDIRRWRPWGDACVLLQDDRRRAEHIGVDRVLQAVREWAHGVPHPPRRP